ncbi:DNA alkylation repair protein [Lactobacillus agrestimuris]|uniref:DNA alkylation repair protein n=1 Tax=Lactobacillus agrestimuris TaxID=2941328 RepID=UPI0020444923|nr:DNA alkylation repair protein [Lactobacillus agrestimuris]
MYTEIKDGFIQLADPDKAVLLAKYMRNQFEFFGLQAPERKSVYKDFLKSEKKKKVIDWNLLNKAWNDEHREFQYFVCDYLIAMKKFVDFEDIPNVEKFVRTKQWWDTIDALIKVYGDVALRDERMNSLMLKWSTDSDFWVRRLSIEHQLLRKEKMNTDLLDKILQNNLSSDEFFINKAIGWALRDYSKTDPNWVKAFIEEHKNQMATLSIKEGSKYLN